MGELYESRKKAEQVAESLGCAGAHKHQDGWMPCSTHSEYQDITQKPHKGRGVLGIDTLPGGGLVSAPVSGKADRLAATPAAPSERIRGSNRNRAGTAASTRAARGINMNPATEVTLREKVKKHNANAPKGRKTSLATLKAVYRRGAGAFSVSHRPGMQRNQWAMGRVNAFLKMLSSGRPKSLSYVNDNDLLPEDHPWRKSRKKSQAKTLEDNKYGGFDTSSSSATLLTTNPLGVSLRAGRGVALDGQAQYALLAKLRHHNSENDNKTSLDASINNKTSLGVLKRVYRRGVGSYGLTPRSETRQQWGMKRVDQFLHLLRTGLPAESSYVGDNDLLPGEHPWVVKSIEIREADFMEVKKIGRRLRRIKPTRKRILRAVFNAGARDADGDGTVQDGTEFERPATGVTPKIVSGLRKRTEGAQRLAKKIRTRRRSAVEKVDIDSAIKSLQEKDGGFTVRLVDRTSMPSGWAVARDGQGVVVPKSTMFKDGKSTLEGRLILMAFIDEHVIQLTGKEDTKDRTTALGAWHNPDTGLIHFDVTDVFSKESTSKDEAIRLGAERNQISIADLDKVKAEDWDDAFHKSGGTGGDVIDPSSLEDRMRSLAVENNVPGAASMNRDQLRPSTRIRSETGPEGIEMALAEPIAELASKHGEPQDWHGVIAIDMDRRKEIADFYDNAPNVSANNASKEVIEAYEALAREVEEQYRMLVEQMRITVEFLDTDPYESFEEMRADFVKNRRLRIMQTAVTGSHPLFTDEQNDMFRAVHDAFGHLATGRGFDRHGEEAAYQAHKTMFKELATKALATETRGQNQFLLDRGYFGDQKLVLLPEKMMKSLRYLMRILAKVAKSDRTVTKIQRDSDSDNGYTFTQSHHVTGGRVLKAQRSKPKSGNGRK